MFGRRRRAAAPDESVALVPVFGVDDRGAAIFHGITNSNAAHLNSAVRIDARGEGTWGGDTRAPQVVMSTNRLGGGSPVVEPGGTIDQESGSIISNPVQRIFTERMAAGRYS